MLSFSTLIAFAAVAVAALFMPGPSVIYIVTRSLQQGHRAGLVSLLGVELGSLVHVGAAAAGLSAVLASSAVAFTVIRYVGAAYLIFLGVRTLRQRGRDVLTMAADVRQVPLGRVFGQGLVVNVFNPKTTLFFMALLPQFIDPAGGAVPLQVILLGLLFTLLAVVCDSGYVLLASTVAALLRRSVIFGRALRYVTGGTYLGLGVTTAVSGSPRPSTS